MEKALALTLLLLFTILITKQRCVDGQAFCQYQISLANEACSLRNFPVTPVPRQLLNDPSTSTTATTDGGGKEHELRSRDDEDDDEEGPRQLLNDPSTSTTATTDGGGKEHELRSRDDEDDDDDEEGDRGEGRHHHHRRQGHRHSADNSDRDPYDTACCRRLMAIDSACVCLAAARLPLFMTSVRHVIRLTPEDGCDVSFECPGSTPLG